MKHQGITGIILTLLTALVLVYQGCQGGDVNSSNQASSFNEPGPENLEPVTKEQLQQSFRRASLIFLEKAPTQEELEKAGSPSGYRKSIDELVDSPQFVQKIRSYHQDYFDMSGTDGDVNMNEPANLASFLFKENLDFRQILRADYCVNDSLEKGNCSSFDNDAELAKEFGAGVVTTQAFLKKWEGAFNFRRTSHMLQAFACHDYPDESDPGLFPEEVSEKVQTFACTDCNPKCYSCHRTMNARASLFYDFDTTGAFNTSPGNNVATKRDDGTVSTVADLLNEGVKPRFRQREVANLKEYAFELTRAPKFRKCLAKRLTLLALGAQSHEGELPTLLKDIDQGLIRHQFQLKSFYKELLGSDEYVLQ